MGRRASCARAKASASNQETWTTGRCGSSGSELPRRHSAREVRRPARGSRDVVLLLPRPALVGPPLAALVAAALDEGQVAGVGDRRAADQVAANVGAVARALVVVGEAAARRRRSCSRRPGSRRARARRRSTRPGARAPSDPPAGPGSRSRAGARAGASAASSRCAAARGGAPSRGGGRRRLRARRSPRACAPRTASRYSRASAAPRNGSSPRLGPRGLERVVDVVSSSRSSGRPPKRCTSHRSSNAAMCPRSQTSGLINVEWTRSRSGVGDRGDERQRALARLIERRRPLAPRSARAALASGWPSSRHCSILDVSANETPATVNANRIPEEQRAVALERPQHASAAGSGSSGPVEIVGPWPPPASFGARVRNSSSTSRSRSSAPNSVGPPSHSSDATPWSAAQPPHHRRQRQLPGIELDDLDLRGRRRLDRPRREDDDARLRLGEQRDVHRNVAAPGDDAGQRLGRVAALDADVAAAPGP